MPGEIEVGRAAVRIFADDSPFWRSIREISTARVKDIEVGATANTTQARANIEALKKESAGADDTIEIKGNADTATAKVNIESLKRTSASADDTIHIGVDKDSFSALSAAKSGINDLGETIRNFGEVLSVIRLPALIAGIGAIPAIAASAAVAVGRLALGIGQGLTGAAAVGGVAIGGMVAGLGGFVAITKNVIKSSLDTYTRLQHMATAAGGFANVLKRVEPSARPAIRAIWDFGHNVDLVRGKWSDFTGTLTAPVLSRASRILQILASRMGALEKPIRRLEIGGAKIALSFAKALNQGERFQRVQKVLNFVASSGLRALRVAKNLGLALLAAVQPVLHPAANLQKTFVRLSVTFRKWAESARGQRQITKFIQTTWHRAKQLYAIVRNLARGFKNLFDIIRPGTGNMMKSLVGLSRSFARVGAKGTESRKKIQQFVKDSQPILRAIWNLVKELAKQFLILAQHVAHMRTGTHHVHTLAGAINGLRKAIRPLRKMFEQTFKNLGPEIAPAARQAARFLKVFAGSSGVLKATLRLMTRLVRQFNKLPDPVKHAVANLVALRVVAKLLGLTTLVSLAGSLGKVVGKLILGRKNAGPFAGKLKEVGKAAGRGGKAGGGVIARMLGLALVIGRLAFPVLVVAGFADKLFNAGRGSKFLTQQLWDAVPALKKFNDRLKASNNKDHLAGFVNFLGTLSKGIPFDKIAAGMKRMGDESAKQAKNSKSHTATVVSAWGGAQKALVGHSIIPDMINATNRWLGPELKKGTTAAGKNAVSMKNAIAQQLKQMVASAKSNMTAFVSAIRNVNLSAVGHDIIIGFLNGLKSAWSAVQSWMAKAAQSIPDTVKKVLQHGSPSRVMYAVGRDTVQGYLNALRDGLPAIEALAGQMADRVTAGARARARARGRRGSFGGMIRAEDGSMVPADYYRHTSREGAHLNRVVERFDARGGLQRQAVTFVLHQHGADNQSDEQTIREIRRYLRQLRRRSRHDSGARGGAT